MSKPASIAADLQSTLGPGHAPARPASVSLHQVDLNLFRVFEAVMKHRSITCASRDLYLTPSAVSHALSRLRAVLSDKLFIAGETGMEPTARALELAPHVRGGLARIDAALTGQTVAPVNVRRTFPIAASDYGGAPWRQRAAG
jgi:DNA-binding transcriptional LysR family regulator